MRASSRPVAILVNDVIAVSEFGEDSIMAAEDRYPGIEYLKGITRLKGDIVYIYELDTFLSSADEVKIEQLLGRPAGNGKEPPDQNSRNAGGLNIPPLLLARRNRFVETIMGLHFPPPRLGDLRKRQQIEAYIGNHSEARFSHGICPDCAIKLYPEVFGNHEKK